MNIILDGIYRYYMIQKNKQLVKPITVQNMTLFSTLREREREGVKEYIIQYKYKLLTNWVL